MGRFLGPAQAISRGGFFGGAPAALNLLIAQDYIFSEPGATGLNLTTLMTAQQKTDWANGVYSVANLAAGGNPVRGYWVVSGIGGGRAGVNSSFGLAIDVLPATPVTLNIDASRLRFYGGGGYGGSPTFGGAGAGALVVFGAGTININIALQSGANIGRLYGGGGGGGGNNGGGGAAGWSTGISGGTGSPGGVYDAGNGGTSNVNVPGGAGAGAGGAGGAMGVPGTAGGFAGGAAGKAVDRQAQPGVTTVTGSNPLYVRGVVQ